MSTVIVEKYSSDNFYQTEGILEEVRTGLLEYADTASETAYTDVLEKTGRNVQREEIGMII